MVIFDIQNVDSILDQGTPVSIFFRSPLDVPGISLFGFFESKDIEQFTVKFPV